MKVRFKKLHPDAVIPKHATKGSAGLDLVAVSKERIGHQYFYDTGLAVEIPEGYVGVIVPRSSVRKKNLRLSNNIGAIDSDYRGPIGFFFDYLHVNNYDLMKEVLYEVGDRIGQLIIIPYLQVEPEEIEELETTERGTGGWGSTGN